MLTLINLPTANQVMSSSSEWANPFFQEFFPYALVSLGIIIAFMLIAFLKDSFVNGIQNMTKPKIKYEDTSEGQYRKEHGETIFD